MATAKTRATDDDRTNTCQVLDTALGDGQLSMEEHRQRVSSATKAVTLAELQSLVSDLQIRSAPAAIRPDSSKGIWVAAAVVVLLAAAGIGWAVHGGTAPSKSTASAGSPTAAAASPKPSTATAPQPPQDLLSLGGLTGLLAQMGKNFGDTLGYQLDIRSGRADLLRPDAVNGHKTVLWIYSDGTWAKIKDDATTPIHATVGDLSKFDPQAIVGAVRDAPQTLGIVNASDEWLDIQSTQDGSLALRVHVSQGGQGGGYVALGADGSVIRISGPGQ
ncbi:DUF1707 domain-containing protein [Mycobacterium sp. 1274761.0]|uniref:DUF1707 SHOCT-like domain-containing protein n=1 Tax=Mycobacterium sp. 1274761.0 TaxID=1834077 RepID=UPI0009EDF01B|nr:DUF1707 domain-containing protein [Mycobacterium sp. 1274761.0]